MTFESEEPKSLRDEFAMSCPKSWVKRNTPLTYGGLRDAMVHRSIISKLCLTQSAHGSFGLAEENKLDAAIRYEYADAMMAERRKNLGE